VQIEITSSKFIVTHDISGGSFGIVKNVAGVTYLSLKAADLVLSYFY
jgi:hypothetical protein